MDDFDKLWEFIGTGKTIDPTDPKQFDLLVDALGQEGLQQLGLIPLERKFKESDNRVFAFMIKTFMEEEGDNKSAAILGTLNRMHKDAFDNEKTLTDIIAKVMDIQKELIELEGKTLDKVVKKSKTGQLNKDLFNHTSMFLKTEFGLSIDRQRPGA